MNATTAAPTPAPPPSLTDAELRALSYFAIGVSSEGSVAGRDVSNRLSFAGNIRGGVMDPVGNSGYSIGTLQTDLGQHPEAVPPLIDAYQAWARTAHPDWVLSDAQRAQATADLGRDGNAIRRDAGRDVDATIKSHLGEYLRTDDGRTFVHNRDVAQVDELMTGVMSRVQQTALYRNSTPDDQARLATIVGKVQNQSGDRWTPGMLRSMDDGTFRSVADVSGAVDNLLPRTTGERDYMESGRDHALAGAEVLNGLRNANAQSPLHDTWQHVVANPLVDPTQLGNDAARPNLAAEYDTVKTLFMQPTEARPFISALDHGGAYAYGRPQAEGTRAATAGLYASGNDFAIWNRNGVGHANIGGVWSELDRGTVFRQRNNDGSTDLDIERNGHRAPLLHVDPRAPNLRAELDPSLSPSQSASPREVAESPLLRQAREQVANLDASLGRTPDARSERLSGSLAVLAAESGMQRIDHVVLSREANGFPFGDRVFVVQGRLDDPAHQRAQMDTAVATRTPVDESVQRLSQVQQQTQAQPTQQVELAQQQDISRGARTL